MPFGLHATGVFPAMINEILSEYLDISCGVSRHFSCFPDNLDSHKRHVRTILAKVAGNRPNLKAVKIRVPTTTETEYLGYVISPKGLRMDEERFDDSGMAGASKHQRIQSFLDLPNFTDDSSKITARSRQP